MRSFSIWTDDSACRITRHEIGVFFLLARSPDQIRTNFQCTSAKIFVYLRRQHNDAPNFTKNCTELPAIVRNITDKFTFRRNGHELLWPKTNEKGSMFAISLARPIWHWSTVKKRACATSSMRVVYACLCICVGVCVQICIWIWKALDSQMALLISTWSTTCARNQDWSKLTDWTPDAIAEHSKTDSKCLGTD